jgi:hypothetical protein
MLAIINTMDAEYTEEQIIQKIINSPFTVAEIEKYVEEMENLIYGGISEETAYNIIEAWIKEKQDKKKN